MSEHAHATPLRLWWLTAALIAINVLLWLWALLHGVSWLQPNIADLLHWGANFVPLSLTGDAWRLISNTFLHIGAIHLLVNMWALYSFGVYAEFYFGRLFYLALYLLTGISGSLTSCWWHWAEAEQWARGSAQVIPAVSAGASGAIMGLSAALIVAAWRPRADLPVDQRLNLKALLVIMAINIALGSSIDGIDNAAHLGGAVAGALLAWWFAISQLAAKSWRMGLQLAGCAVFLAALGLWLQHLQQQSLMLLPLRLEVLAELAQR